VQEIIQASAVQAVSLIISELFANLFSVTITESRRTMRTDETKCQLGKPFR